MNVLYVATDKNDPEDMCPGSIVCLFLSEKFPAGTISIQNCDILRQSKKLPDWLNGTPIFVNEDEGIPHKGKDAIKRMQQLVHSFPQQQQQTQSLNANENTKELSGSLDDNFHMDVQVNEEASTGKVTEQDLQKFMEMRNSTVAGRQQKQASA